MPDHTPEPWTAYGYELRADYEAGGWYTKVVQAVVPRGRRQARQLIADLKRIALCVNACAGLSNAELEARIEHLKEMGWQSRQQG